MYSTLHMCSVWGLLRSWSVLSSAGNSFNFHKTLTFASISEMHEWFMIPWAFCCRFWNPYIKIGEIHVESNNEDSSKSHIFPNKASGAAKTRRSRSKWSRKSFWHTFCTLDLPCSQHLQVLRQASITHCLDDLTAGISHFMTKHSCLLSHYQEQTHGS